MRLSASISFLFQELPLLERFDAARTAGFEAVEIQRLTEGDPVEMARAARDAGVQVALVNVPSGNYSSGGDGLSGVPGLEEEFRMSFERALEAATVLRAQHLHLGPSRIPAGHVRGECLKTYHANIRAALATSSTADTSLLIEAMNRVEAPTALLSDVSAAAEVVESIGNARLGLQFDIYHVAMNDENPLHAYERYRAHTRHVQFADAPGRNEPGTGRLNIPALLRAIEGSGYTGWFGAEYRPRHTTSSSFEWLRDVQTRSAA